MPRKPCYWTRKLELDLVEFVRQREYIWKPVGNTNHHIQQKYKAYAEFASQLGRGFTARSVRDRWVNIRSTFNHNLRKVDKSKETAKTLADVYVPCWPLWKSLQFLRDISRKEDEGIIYLGFRPENETQEIAVEIQVKEESKSDFSGPEMLTIRQRSQRTDRPRRKTSILHNKHGYRNKKCMKIVDDLVVAMRPLVGLCSENESQSYWFFGRHVTERLNSMRDIDAQCASQDIMNLLDSLPQSYDNT